MLPLRAGFLSLGGESNCLTTSRLGMGARISQQRFWVPATHFSNPAFPGAATAPHHPSVPQPSGRLFKNSLPRCVLPSANSKLVQVDGQASRHRPRLRRTPRRTRPSRGTHGGLQEQQGIQDVHPAKKPLEKRLTETRFREARRYFGGSPPTLALPPRLPPAPDLALRPPEPQVGVHGAAASGRRRGGTVRLLHAPPGRGAAAPGSPSPAGSGWRLGRLPALRRRRGGTEGGREAACRRLGPGPRGSEGPRSAARESPQGKPRREGRRTAVRKGPIAFSPSLGFPPCATREGRVEERDCRETACAPPR